MQRIQWLEGTGNQWIETGLHLDSDSSIESVLSVEDTGTQFIFGVYGGNKAFTLAGAQSGKYIHDFGSGNRISSTNNVQVGVFVKLAVLQKAFFVNDVREGANSVSFSAGSESALLFGWNRILLDGTKQGGKVRIASCKITGADGSRDFEPVRVANVGYLYDRVTRTLFGNAGSGAFICGPNGSYQQGGGRWLLLCRSSRDRCSSERRAA